MMKKAGLKPILLLTTLVLGVLQQAYVYQVASDARRLTLGGPLRMELWREFAAGNPAFTPETDPESVLRQALESWVQASSLTLTLSTGGSVAEARKDGRSVITIADTPSNRSLVGQTNLAVTKMWLAGSRIQEADIVFNPAYKWSSESWGGGWSLLQTGMHEIGHAIGLAHSIDRSEVMYFQGGYFEHRGDRLSWGDIAGINSSFPMLGIDRLTGTIVGRTTTGNRPVFGAFVVAIDGDGLLVASALSMPDGSYRIEHVPPGDYTLYAEPMDGPMTSSNLYLSGLSTQSINTNFRPQFFRDSMAPTLRVIAGGVSRADFPLKPGTSAVDPMWTRIDADPQSSGLFTSGVVMAETGSSSHLGVAGKGADRLADDSGVFFLSSELRTGRVSRSHRSASGVDFKWYPLEVSDRAPRGTYSVFARNAGEIGVITGGLHVDSDLQFSSGFPQYAQAPGQIQSEVLIVNASVAQPARVRLKAMDAEGGDAPVQFLAMGPTAVDNQGEFRVSAGGAVVMAGDKAAEFSGSLRAESNSAFSSVLLITTPAGSASLVPSAPLHSFVAPIAIDRANGENTGVALTNFDDRPAQIFVQIQTSDGTAVASNVLELPGGGQVSQYVSEMVPGLPANFVGTAGVTSTRLVGATVIRTSRDSFTTYPVVRGKSEPRCFFAQFAHGDGLSSELLLVNPSPREVASEVRVKVRGSDGAPARVELNGEMALDGAKTVRIQPLGMVSLKTTGATGLSGFVEISSDVPVGGVVLFRSPGRGVVGVGESPPAKRIAVAVDRDLNAGRDTGLALVNVEHRPIRVTLTARDGMGNVAGTAQIDLRPGQQLARFAGQAPWNLGLSDRFTGSFWLEADGGLAATAIRVSPSGMAALPPMPLNR